MQTQSHLKNRLFPANLLHADWQLFPARGFRKPVTGVIFRGSPHPTCGMPIGGLDTGCFDIEANGMLGYSTIFNHLIEPRLLVNLPLFGMSVDGKAWVLVSDRLGKRDTPVHSQSAVNFPPTDYTPHHFNIGLDGVETAESIDYWGHFPILDMEFNTPAPVQAGVRVWSPFLPGDTATSMTPGAVLEMHLSNTDDAAHRGRFVVSLPGFETPKSGATIQRETLTGELNGVSVESGTRDDAWDMRYVLAALDKVRVAHGGALDADGAAWANVAQSLPASNGAGASLALDFDLAPGETVVYRVVFAWYAPHWRSGGAPAHDQTNLFTHMYAKQYASAVDVATFLARNHESLLRRVIGWQETIYQAPNLPGWLADSLINVLHLIPECSIWGQAADPIGDWCRPEDGIFGLNECPRGCPQIECIPCSFYGNIPIVYFFPDAALSTLRTYKGYQYDDGRPPWIFGGITASDAANKPPYDLAKPDKGYQTVLNGACYIIMVDRYWRVSGDDGILAEFWESLKRCNDFSLNLRPEYGLSQIMAMPAPGTDTHGPAADTEWFEAPEPGWRGYVTHAGGVRMAQAMIMRRMAEAMGDDTYRAKCDEWLKAGAEALETHLWQGAYYLNFNEPETGQRSDLIFGYQLDGQWVTEWHGVPNVFPEERVRTTLDTLRRVNAALSDSGAVNYANPDGTPAKVGGYGTYSYFPPELFMLAMNYMYEDQRSFGLELLHKCLYNVTCRWGYTWDFPNTFRGDADTGQRTFGADYYQNMMLWAVPAALSGSPIDAPAQGDGLVRQVIEASTQ